MKVFALTMVVVIVVAVFGYMAGLVRLIGGRVLMHEEEFGVMCGQRCDKFQKNIVASVTDRQMLQTLTSECTPFNKELHAEQCLAARACGNTPYVLVQAALSGCTNVNAAI